MDSYPNVIKDLAKDVRSLVDALVEEGFTEAYALHFAYGFFVGKHK